MREKKEEVTETHNKRNENENENEHENQDHFQQICRSANRSNAPIDNHVQQNGVIWTGAAIPNALFR